MIDSLFQTARGIGGGLLGNLPGIGTIAAFANWQVLAVICLVGIGAYFYGDHKATQYMRAVCAAAAEKAKARGAAVDREALEAQVSDLEKRLDQRNKDGEAADRRIADYEKQLASLGSDRRCILNDDDIRRLQHHPPESPGSS